MIAAVRRLADKPIRYILNTGASPDHTGGNEALARAGGRIGTQMVAAALAGEAAAILSHEKVLNAMSAPSGKQSPTPFAAQPTDTYFTTSGTSSSTAKRFSCCINPPPTPMATASSSSAGRTSSSPAMCSISPVIR